MYRRNTYKQFLREQNDNILQLTTMLPGILNKDEKF